VPLGPINTTFSVKVKGHYTYLSRCMLWSNSNVNDFDLLFENGSQSCVLVSPLLVTVT